MSLRYCLIDSTIRAVTVVFISIAKCLKSSSSSIGIFIVVLVSSSSTVSSVSMYDISIHRYIYLWFNRYIFYRTDIALYEQIDLSLPWRRDILPDRGIDLYILYILYILIYV